VSDGIKKSLPEEKPMSIEKKSLISNRVAAKKAIATKASASKVTSTKMKGAYVSANAVRLSSTSVRMNANKVRF